MNLIIIFALASGIIVNAFNCWMLNKRITMMHMRLDNRLVKMAQYGKLITERVEIQDRIITNIRQQLDILEDLWKIYAKDLKK